MSFQEEALRQKRLSSRADGDSSASAAAAAAAAAASDGSKSYTSTMVTAGNPNAAALSTVYLYGALVILILGVIIGKWVL